MDCKLKGAWYLQQRQLWAIWRRKGNLWLHMILSGYNGSTNGCQWVCEALRTGLGVAKTRQVRYGGEAAEHPRNTLLCN